MDRRIQLPFLGAARDVAYREGRWTKNFGTIAYLNSSPTSPTLFGARGGSRTEVATYHCYQATSSAADWLQYNLGPIEKNSQKLNFIVQSFISKSVQSSLCMNSSQQCRGAVPG
eukprot:3415860-Rhodomonas_salina.2